ncbi:MAG TPA: undecaprenyldiphospho-muramoylpentapeptide beta-N-acetylglucosaminyltransferase [Thermoanaerobaculia bacterium]
MGVTTLMIAGGGTGGHIYPAIAIAREFLARDASRRVVFVGTEYGLEKTIVPKAGFPLEFISVGGLKGKGPLDLAKNLLRLPLGFIQAWRVAGKHKPRAVLGVGGYSSGPVLLAAWLRRVPTIIHESNAFPGLTNRLVAKFVKAVAVAFADAAPRLKRSDAVVTGNPVRAEFFSAQPRNRETAQRLLVFGGSQGSKILNDAMTRALPLLPPTLAIVHQTGPKMLDDVQRAYGDRPNARVVAYIDPMVDELANADFVISRAGAMTIGELAAVGRAAVLVPFAAATNNHQELNARVMERAGAAIVITEKELTPERLAAAIGEIDPQRMGAAAKALAQPEATKKIVDTIEKII